MYQRCLIPPESIPPSARYEKLFEKKVHYFWGYRNHIITDLDSELPINEVKDLAFGLYGKTPTPVDPEVQKKVLKNYKRGEPPVTGRAADYLEPELDKVRERIGNLSKDDYDLLIAALYPTTGEQFLKWKYGLEEKLASVKPKTLEDIRREDEAMAAALEEVCKSI